MIWTYKKMVKNTGELFCAESAFSSLAILDRFVRLTDFERLTMESLALAAYIGAQSSMITEWRICHSIFKTK